MSIDPAAAPAKHFIRNRGSDLDWCHICGYRKRWTVDIWYPENAEHDPPVLTQSMGARYLRMCGDCASTIADVSAMKWGPPIK